MNRRQEIAVYVVGILLAGISAYNGHENDEWLFGAFVPVFILGILAVFALRTRGASAVDPVDALKKGLGVTIALVVASQLLTQAHEVQSKVSSVEWDTDRTKSEVADLRTDMEHLDRQVRSLELNQLLNR